MSVFHTGAHVQLAVALTMSNLINRVVASHEGSVVRGFSMCANFPHQTRRTCPCGSGQRAYRCTKCKRGPGVCQEHGRRAENCVLCLRGNTNSSRFATPRSMLCACGKRRDTCRVHGGASLCVECHLTKVSVYGTRCSVCRRAESGNKPRRLREMHVKNILEAAAARNDIPLYTSHDRYVDPSLDPIVYGKHRPDFVFKLRTHWVIVEVDERQHRTMGYQCERRREMNLFNSAKGLPVIMLRFNPDSFHTGSFSARQLARLKQVTKASRDAVLLQWTRRAIHAPHSILQNRNRFAHVRLFYDCECKVDSVNQRDHVCGFAHVTVFVDDVHFAATIAV